MARARGDVCQPGLPRARERSAAGAAALCDRALRCVGYFGGSGGDGDGDSARLLRRQGRAATAAAGTDAPARKQRASSSPRLF